MMTKMLKRVQHDVLGYISFTQKRRHPELDSEAQHNYSHCERGTTDAISVLHKKTPLPKHAFLHVRKW